LGGGGFPRPKQGLKWGSCGPLGPHLAGGGGGGVAQGGGGEFGVLLNGGKGPGLSGPRARGPPPGIF